MLDVLITRLLVPRGLRTSGHHRDSVSSVARTSRWQSKSYSATMMSWPKAAAIVTRKHCTLMLAVLPIAEDVSEHIVLSTSGEALLCLVVQYMQQCVRTQATRAVVCTKYLYLGYLTASGSKRADAIAGRNLPSFNTR